MTVLVNLIVGLGMLVVLPLGLRLLPGDELAVVRRWWLLWAVPGALSLWLPRGGWAVGLAVIYGLGTLALVGCAALRARRWSVERVGGFAVEVAMLTALVTPAIAASALIAERGGYQLFGFKLGILALTVAHFHYAGFAAALVAGLVASAAERWTVSAGRAARMAALSVPAGTGLVLLGYFTNDFVELAGAAVLTGGMWLVGWLTWREVRARAADRLTRALFATTSITLIVTMLLALDWAAGQAMGVPHLSLTWMAATHGLANALGFGLCSVLAWRKLGARRLTPQQ